MYGMPSALPPLLAIVLCVACAGPTPTPADPLPNYASRLAAGLEQQSAELGREMRLAFPAGGAEAQTASRQLDALAIEMRMQVLSWRALESHAAELREVLAHPGTSARRIEGITLAFRELHLHLLQTGLGERLGIGLARQQQIESAMMGAADEAEAIAVSLPALQQLLAAMEQAAAPLEKQLEQTRQQVLQLHQVANAATLGNHQALQQRRAALARSLAAIAAGVAPAEPDAARELAASEADWAASETALATYEARHRALEEIFREAQSHVHGLRRATLEWGVALREVGKALDRDRSAANLRLIAASVEEWGL